MKNIEITPKKSAAKLTIKHFFFSSMSVGFPDETAIPATEIDINNNGIIEFIIIPNPSLLNTD